MLISKADAAAVTAEVNRLFGHDPTIHVTYRSGRTLYEVQVFALHCNNVGRGESLRSALHHLKEVNRLV